AEVTAQQAEPRRKKILIADMDSTMIDQECIDELADEIGVKDHVAAITARSMNGEIAFEPALRERVALLKGLDAAVVDRIVANRLTLAAGGRVLVRTMRANGAWTALVSGGFEVFTTRIAAMLGFQE
ncbi:phosphoserine phosphatase SerB, partial [Mesorhizobium sp. M7A.F.Ca.CA.004.05.1.1]